MNTKAYIDSGILEAFVLGSASEQETKDLLHFKDQYPEIRAALHELELDIEYIAKDMAITPPPGSWAKISDGIDGLTTAQPKQLRLVPNPEDDNGHASKQDKYIEVESETTHMRLHKNWKWIFAAVFILAKIFLVAAIYFYLENRQAQKQIQELKSELKHTQVP